jgi:hypothetical protein
MTRFWECSLRYWAVSNLLWLPSNSCTYVSSSQQRFAWPGCFLFSLGTRAARSLSATLSLSAFYAEKA